MGEEAYTKFLQTPFADLDQYEALYLDWIEQHIISEKRRLTGCLRAMGLQDTRLMAKYFLRLFHEYELTKQK